jgi:hypothetical protein
MSEINHFKILLLCKMMWQMMLKDADVNILYVKRMI